MYLKSLYVGADQKMTIVFNLVHDNNSEFSRR